MNIGYKLRKSRTKTDQSIRQNNRVIVQYRTTSCLQQRQPIRWNMKESSNNQPTPVISPQVHFIPFSNCPHGMFHKIFISLLAARPYRGEHMRLSDMGLPENSCFNNSHPGIYLIHDTLAFTKLLASFVSLRDLIPNPSSLRS